MMELSSKRRATAVLLAVVAASVLMGCREKSKPPTTKPARATTQAATQLATQPALTLKYRQGVDHVAFSPDGRMLGSASGIRLRLTDVRTGKLVRTARGAHANSIAFSPDGKLLLRGTNVGKVEVLGIPTLVREHVLPVTRWSIYAVAVSSDSRLVAACAADGTVQVWDIDAARKLRTVGSKGERMAALAFSPDGKRMAALSRYGRCDVWDVATGKLAATATGVGNETGELRFSPDGGTLVIASGGDIHLWKLRADRTPAKVKVPDVLVGKPRINGFGFSPEQGRPMDAPLGDFAFGPASISPDLRIAATVLENGKIALWDVSRRRVLRILPVGHVPDLFGGGVQSIAFSANGEFLATGNRSGHAEVWQLKGDKLLTPSTQPIDAHGTPGPWGAALNGLRTRLILTPVKPSWEANDDLHARPAPGRRMPLSEGVWWRVNLQVKNETDRELMIVWPELRRAGGIVITDQDGQPVVYHPVAGDHPVTRQIPSSLLRGGISTMNSILLGRNHDMGRLGKYRIQFPRTEAKRPLPDTVTNPTLPASNVLTFENTPATKPASASATQPAAGRNTQKMNPPPNYTGKWTVWYTNGPKRSEAQYSNGTRHGARTSWHPDGQKHIEENYKNGRQHGTSTMWYSNARRQYTIDWENGEKHGKQVSWYHNGWKEDERVFEKGKFIRAISVTGTLTPRKWGVQRAKEDIAKGRKRIYYYGKPWSAGKPLVDDRSGLPVEILAGCTVTKALTERVEAYNETIRASVIHPAAPATGPATQPAVGNAKRAQIAKPVAEPFGQAIGKHILTIRTNPAGKAKKAAGEALAEIGLPSLKPLMDYLHQVAEAKPGDQRWISPEYIQRDISTVCKRVGPTAERAILKRFLQTANETERKHLFRALAGGSSYPKALAHLLGAIRAEGALRGNAKWAVERVVHLYVFGGWGRDEAAISEILGIFSRYPDLKKKHREIRRHLTVLKTVGAPKKEMTFSPVIHRPLSIVVDEQTEFFIALPKTAGFAYHWGVGKGRKPGINWRAHGLLYLGRVLGKGKVNYYRFLGTRALKTPFNAHVQGGVPDDDPAEYPMTLTVRALSPEKKAKRLRELRSSLDEQKRKYAELVRLIDELGRADVGGVARIAAAAKAIGSQALPALTDAIGNRDTSTEAQRRRYGLARVIGEFRRKAFGAVPALCKALKDEDPNVRSAAAIALGAIGDPRAAKPLTGVLSDKVYRPRQDAVDALVKIGKPATKAVLEGLRSSSSWGPASSVLRETKDPQAVEPLIKDLKDKSRIVRRGAAIGLGRIGDRRAVKPLIELLKDTDPYVRADAALALQWIGGTPLEVWKGALRDESSQVRELAASALASRGNTDATELLVGALKDKDVGVRNHAVMALSELRDPQAVAGLIEALGDKNKTIRRNVAWALGRLRNRRAVKPLIAALKDEGAEVRAAAAWALGEIKDSQALDALSNTLRDEDPVVRVRAAMALGNLRDKRAVAALVEALKDPDGEVVIRAAGALGEIKDARAVEPLIAALKSELKNPRKIVRPLVRKSTEELPWARQGSDVGVAIALVEALGSMGDKRAVDPLAAALNDKRWRLRTTIARALGRCKGRGAVTVLLGALKDEHAAVRSASVRSLGRIKDPRAIEPLIAALKDRHSGVRSVAPSALRSITGLNPASTWEEWQEWWELNKEKWQTPAATRCAEADSSQAQPAVKSTSKPATQSSSPQAQPALPEPVLRGLGGRLAIRVEAKSWEALVKKVAPTFTWGGRDMMWIGKGEKGEALFVMDRAYVYQPAGKAPRWVLLEYKSAPHDKWVAQIMGQCIRRRAKLCASKPESDHGSGNYAVVKDVTAKDGTVYEVGWQALMGGGTSHVEAERRLYLWHDTDGKWHFVGEGPKESTGKMGYARMYTYRTESRVMWAGPPVKPVVEFTVTCTHHEWRTSDDPDFVPRRDRIQYSECVLDGGFPAALRRTTRHPYMLAAKGETFDTLVQHLASWTSGWGSLGEEHQADILRLWREALTRLNPKLPRGAIPEGTRIYVLTYAESLDAMKKIQAEPPHKQ